MDATSSYIPGKSRNVSIMAERVKHVAAMLMRLTGPLISGSLRPEFMQLGLNLRVYITNDQNPVLLYYYYL